MRQLRINLLKKVIIAGIITSAVTFSLWDDIKSSTVFKNTIHLVENKIQSLSIENDVSCTNFIVNVTKKCAPSVVAIEIRNNTKIDPDSGVALITSTGSGFVVKKDGWILTNAHVIMNKPNSTVSIVTTKNEVYEATVTDIDLKLDLALLKIDTNNLPAMKIGDSNSVTLGEWVVALGSPLSMKHTITAGVISCVNRNGKDLGLSNNTIDYIQTDAAITFGHSGGPLVNLKGEVIGVNNLRITAGIAFAIPSFYVKEFLLRSCIHSKDNQMVQNSMQNPKFGITSLPLSNEIINNFNQQGDIIIPNDTKGILIWNVVNASIACQSGLKVGDVITHINNIEIKSVTQFYNTLSQFKNATVSFRVLRNGTVLITSFKNV